LLDELLILLVDADFLIFFCLANFIAALEAFHWSMT
jgi:hypothetical protein